MAEIPLFLHEEHHEAFLIWHYAIRRGLLPAQQNVLLHVDSHADMAPPVLRTPIRQFPQTLAAIAQFTYDELGIATFMLPAIYQRLFPTVYWLHPKPEQTERVEQYVRTYQQAGQHFIVGPASSPWQPDKPWQDRVSFTHQTIALEQSVSEAQSLVLDIDLDFFSCEIFVNSAASVEITPPAAARFEQHTYDPLRLHGNCFLEERDQRYYLHFNFNIGQPIKTSARLSEAAIVQRIDRFGGFLRDNHITPALIDVCRSRFSGYTPEDQWEFIERRLLAQLRELYSIESIPLDAILNAERV